MYNKYMIIFMISLFICISGCEQQTKNKLEESTQSLQDQALNKNVDPYHGVMVIEIVAMTKENDSTSSLNQIIKLIPSSKDINLNDIDLAVHDEKFLYEYSKESCNNVQGHQFGVEYKMKGNNWKEDYISKGDVVNLCYEFSNINNYKEMEIKVNIKSGVSTVTNFNIPSCSFEKCHLFP